LYVSFYNTVFAIHDRRIGSSCLLSVVKQNFGKEFGVTKNVFSPEFFHPPFTLKFENSCSSRLLTSASTEWNFYGNWRQENEREEKKTGEK
jgi:hypothetical protein